MDEVPHRGYVVLVPLAAPPGFQRACEQTLTPEEHVKAARFRFDDDRRRFVVARAQLRQLLSNELAVAAHEIQFRYGPRGKPELPEAISGRRVEFNLSHSGDWAVIGVHDGSPIGVDIESHRHIDGLLSLAAEVLSPAEYAALQNLPLPAQPAAFFTAWTRKESLLKAWGSGLHHPLTDIEVSLTAATVVVRAADIDWCITTIDGPPDHSVAIAVRGRECKVRTAPQVANLRLE